jgi:hypothetical protein
LGSAIIPSVGQLVWTILSACDFLVLEFRAERWLLRQISSVERGAPSDWANPWVSVEDASSPASTIASIAASTGQVAAEPPDTVLSPTINTAATAADYWLLPPSPIGDPIEARPGWRPILRVFFAMLWEILSWQEQPEWREAAETARDEVFRILVALGAADPRRGPGPRKDDFLAAWQNNHLDWFHAEMMRLPGYRSAVEQLRADGTARPGGRAEAQVGMARALGQVARLERNEPLIVGDAPISREQLRQALERWLPKPGDAISTIDLCRRAGEELSLTPARLELALERLWIVDPDQPFEGQTGGTVTPGLPENVVALGDQGYRFRSVAPGTLSFGRSGPVRVIVRS